MRRARDKRLARLTADAARGASAEALDRRALRARAAICAMVKKKLVQSGVDAAGARILHRDEMAVLPSEPEASAELRHAEKQLVDSDGDGLAQRFAAKIGEMARRYQDGTAPDLANASLAELLALCLLQNPFGASRGYPPAKCSDLG
jgi:hypothetical protein